MTQYEFDNQKWYKGIQVHINFGNWTGYLAFVDFEKGNLGVSRTSNFYPFEIFKFHEVTVIDKIQPTALDITAAKSYLERFEPELKKKLESHALRGQVCSVMKDYLELHTLLNNKERHEFLKTHLKDQKCN